MKVKAIIFILISLIIISGGFLFWLKVGNGFEWLRNNKMIGNNSKISSGQNNPFGFAGPAEPVDNFSKIQALGVKYIRESISWEAMEPSHNQYNFNIINEEEKLKQYGFEIITRIKLGQIWATKCDTSVDCPKLKGFTCPSQSADCPPKDLGDWSEKGYSPLLYDFTYKTLEYANKNGEIFEYIIIGNEVNTWIFWHGTADDYLKTRATIYKAVHDINSNLKTDYKVVDNGIASTIWGGAILKDNFCTNDQNKRNYAMNFAKKYFRRIYDGPYTEEALDKRLNCDNPSRDYLILKEIFKKDTNLNEPTFDLMSYHFYEPWDTQEEIINWIKNEMKKNGYEKPIMNTEGGYRDTLHLYSDTPSLAQDVANEIPKLHVVAFANNVKTWLWLPFTERGEKYQFYGLEWKGLISEKQKELLAYKSYQIMVAKLAGFDSIEKLDQFTNTYIYKVNFSDKDPLYVIWSEENAQIDLSSEIDGQLIITNVGQKTKTANSSKLNISSSPIYVEKD